MRAVTQYEWTDDGWSPIAVYFFTREMVIGQACEGRPDVAAWVEAVRAGARWTPGQNLEDLATQMCERFTHQEYGSLYDEVEPATTLDALARREFSGIKAKPLPARTLPAPGNSAEITWTPGNFDQLERRIGDESNKAGLPEPEIADLAASPPTAGEVAPLACPACGSSQIASYMYGMPKPDPELEALIRAGEVVLGGCIVFDQQPEYRCNVCRFEFRARREPPRDRLGGPAEA